MYSTLYSDIHSTAVLSTVLALTQRQMEQAERKSPLSKRQTWRLVKEAKGNVPVK